MAKTRISKAPEERRAELIQAARYLFDKNGVDHTRISDIVKHIGVAQGVFYYYFRSKDEIAGVVAEEVINELQTAIHQVVADQQADLFQKLSQLIELYFGLIDQFTGDNELVLPDFDSIDSANNAPVLQAREVLMEQITELVIAGTNQGVIKARYPEWAVGSLEAGLRRMALQQLPTREIVYTLTEQILCLSPGTLLQHVKLKEGI